MQLCPNVSPTSYCILSLVDDGNVWTGLGIYIQQTILMCLPVFLLWWHTTKPKASIVCHIPSPVHTFPPSINGQYILGLDTLGHSYMLLLYSNWLCCEPQYLNKETAAFYMQLIVGACATKCLILCVYLSVRLPVCYHKVCYKPHLYGCHRVLNDVFKTSVMWLLLNMLCSKVLEPFANLHFTSQRATCSSLLYVCFL